MKTILGIITFLLLLPFMWIRLRQKRNRLDVCILCVGVNGHNCLECEKILTKKECKQGDGLCSECVMGVVMT